MPGSLGCIACSDWWVCTAVEGTSVRVQRWEEGSWAFSGYPPGPTRRAGSPLSGWRRAWHRLRMVGPRSGVTSEPFVLVVRRLYSSGISRDLRTV